MIYFTRKFASPKKCFVSSHTVFSAIVSYPLRMPLRSPFIFLPLNGGYFIELYTERTWPTFYIQKHPVAKFTSFFELKLKKLYCYDRCWTLFNSVINCKWFCLSA